MKSYALVGCGSRALMMFAAPIVKDFPHVAKLVGFCDVNQGRMDYFNKDLKTSIPTFPDFDQMIRETKPEVVIIATIDSLHHKYILRAFDHGCDVLCEKPMTIDADKCREILAAEKRTGRKVTVAFNYRFVPYVTKIKELIKQGSIGKVLSVDFNYQLDRVHGADYFRRWHRRKEKSGGLLVHKSTHHFDIVNWFLDQEPTEVFAMGSRVFYGPTRKERGINCRTCDHQKTCEFYFDINAAKAPSKPALNAELYSKVEHLDGYLRDQCVFSDEIDIEDTMNLTVRYSAGTQMSYSLNAHCSYEGWRMALNGTTGRIEASLGGPHVSETKDDILIYRPGKVIETITVPVDLRGHGGGDPRLCKMLFEGPLPDPLNHMASSQAGAISLMTGVAANLSIAQGKSISIAPLLAS